MQSTAYTFDSSDDIAAAFKPNTKALFGEISANPAMSVFDVEKFARVAHGQGVPLIVDAGTFDYASGTLPGFTEPDDSYHGVVYTRDYAAAPFVIKARMQPQRDFGAYPSAHSAFMLNLSLESLDVRMRRHCENAQKVAEYLFTRDDVVTDLRYPGLPSSPYNDLAEKYLEGASGVLTIDVKGGREAGVKFMDALQLIARQVHVADARSCVLHPASTSHRQVLDDQHESVGITPGLVRISVGLENADDIIADIDQALAKVAE